MRVCSSCYVVVCCPLDVMCNNGAWLQSVACCFCRLVLLAAGGAVVWYCGVLYILLCCLEFSNILLVCVKSLCFVYCVDFLMIYLLTSLLKVLWTVHLTASVTFTQFNGHKRLWIKEVWEFSERTVLVNVGWVRISRVLFRCGQCNQKNLLKNESLKKV